MHPTHRRPPAAAFTLVELLVVIGIIGLLISILLPALASARRTAQRTACAAKLSQVMVAAQMHRNEHQGYYPLVGIVPSRNPDAPGDPLNDKYCTKYSYLSLVGTTLEILHGSAPLARGLAPISDALSVYMGFKKQILTRSNADAVANMYDAQGYMRNFICPAQAAGMGEIAPFDAPQNSCILFSLEDNSHYFEPQSYVYNEYVLGFYDKFKRLRGKADRVRQPSLTMFACDGLHGKSGVEVIASGTPLGTFALYNTNTKPVPSVSVGDAFAAPTTPAVGTVAYDPACFDKKRHGGRINVAFCDGHVENRALTAGDLSTVYLMAP